MGTGLLDNVYFWILMYFATNLGLTLYNKAVLQYADFHLPWLLTAIHSLCSFIGSFVCVFLRCSGASSHLKISPEVSSRRGILTLLALSVLYTVNIAVSNISLDMVTLAFHQLVRSTTPVFAVVLSLVFRIKSFSTDTYIALLPVVLGVVMATYGDISFTSWGLFLTVLGTALAAVKTIVTNMILVGDLKLQPMDLLWRMSLLAFVQCLMVAQYSGEMDVLRVKLETADFNFYAVLIGNGVMAFLLNYASFTTNMLSSALTMTVAANIKQVLAIILAIIVFHTHVTPLNAFGIFVTLAGGAQYT
jgi:drug/metabolite transporter (DMT)-like permease